MLTDGEARTNPGIHGEALARRVFAFAEGEVMVRLLGNDRRAESLASLFEAVRRCVESAPGVWDSRGGHVIEGGDGGGDALRTRASNTVDRRR